VGFSRLVGIRLVVGVEGLQVTARRVLVTCDELVFLADAGTGDQFRVPQCAGPVGLEPRARGSAFWPLNLSTRPGAALTTPAAADARVGRWTTIGWCCGVARRHSPL
jgi:hypothetical protein